MLQAFAVAAGLWLAGCGGGTVTADMGGPSTGADMAGATNAPDLAGASSPDMAMPDMAAAGPHVCVFDSTDSYDDGCTYR